MRHAPLMVAVIVLLACSQSKQEARFTPPDGHWWLAAKKSQMDGFYVGYWECADFVLKKPAPAAIADSQVEEKISDYYRTHSKALGLPVTTVIARLYAEWQRTGAYKFSPADPVNEWDGQFWWSNVDDRIGMVLGFLSCQASAGQSASNAQTSKLVSWIDNWYGVDPAGRDSDMQGPRMSQKLSRAFLAAEKANP